jgi:hypothetical protein
MTAAVTDAVPLMVPEVPPTVPKLTVTPVETPMGAGLCMCDNVCALERPVKVIVKVIIFVVVSRTILPLPVAVEALDGTSCALLR